MASARRFGGVLIATVLVVGLSACGATGPRGAPLRAGDVHDCQGTPVPSDVVAGEPSLGVLTPGGRKALDSATYEGIEPLEITDDDGWFVVTETDETIVLLRTLDAGSAPEDGPPGDHELIAVENVVDATNLEPGWYVMKHTVCSLRVDLGGLTVAEVQLDPATPPDPNAREIALLVTERECNSGQDASGRIEVVRLTETESTVEFVLGIAPRGGAQACPQNPQTPFVLELDQPLGSRSVVDAGLVPARKLGSAEGL